MAEQTEVIATYSCFAVTVDGAVAHIRMNRPKQHNSMSSAFWDELPRVIDEIEQNAAVRAAVLSSEGASFCSGMDLAVFQNADLLRTDTAVQRERFRRLVLQLQATLTRIEKCRVPIIAAIQGACIGGAFDLVSACDLRYASKAAYFTIAEISLGMMADMGTLQRLPKLMPEGVVRELALTGDKLSADRAYQLGLVSEVVEDADALTKHALAVAGRIASRAPVAVSGTREAISFARDHSVADALAMAANWQAAIFSAADVMTAVTAQKTGGTPTFTDLDVTKIKV